MTRLQLLLMLVRAAGILIAVNAVVAMFQWLANHHGFDLPLHILAARMLPVFWLCFGVLLICETQFFVRRLSKDASGSSFQIKSFEHVAMRLLGIYLLSQAAADAAHVAVHQFEYLTHLGRLKTWFELPSQDFVSVIGALTKTRSDYSCCSALGVRNVALSGYGRPVGLGSWIDGYTPAIRSIASASAISRSVRPPASWVDSTTSTRL
jgi:hypothetical protein